MNKSIIRNIAQLAMETLRKIGQQLIIGTRLFWFWRFSAVSLTLLLIWLIGGNLLADQLERRMNQEVSTYLEQFPRQEPNDSALKLFTYMAQLGLSTGLEKTAFDSYGRYFRDQPNLRMNSLTSNQSESFQNTIDEAIIYIDSLSNFPGNNIPGIPEKTKEYLSRNSSILSSISRDLTTSEPPELGGDLKFYLGSLELVVPSYLSLNNLSTLLLVDGIRKHKDNLQEESLVDFHASWMIQESLQKNPTLLLTQLISTIIANRQVKVLEKVDRPSDFLIEKLSELNYRESIVKSIQNELLITTTALARGPEEFLWAWDIPSNAFFLAAQRIPQALINPYIRLSGINSFYIQKGNLDKLLLESPCSSSEFTFNIPWWNSIARITLPSFLHLPYRGTEVMLRHELLQKIWEIKAIATSTGAWPQEISNPESTVCPGEKWDYTVQDNEIFITFSQTPDWLRSRIDEGNSAPLEYRRMLDQI